MNTNGYLTMDLLRFTTAGSVDDGKSTLIGRLLYDSKAIFSDQMEAIERASERAGDEHLNLALLTDGLRAEREQGITIDVAYRYFATPKRKFIIADTPGHIQYTRNMVTGASSANLAIILVDSRHGIVEQTRRHAYIATLLGIPQVVFCINKMDLVNYDEATFNQIKEDLGEFSAMLGIKQSTYIPVSALHGDNVVDRSENMSWYDGASLLALLESVPLQGADPDTSARFPIQMVIKGQSDQYVDYRAYAGRVASGVFKVGDRVTIQPSGFSTRIKSISLQNQKLEQAFAPMSVTMTLEDITDVARGDMIVAAGHPAKETNHLELMLCWMNERPLNAGDKFVLRHTTREVDCTVKDINYKVNVNTLQRVPDNEKVGMNDIANVSVETGAPLFVDDYNSNRETGSLIVINETTNETVAAAMVVKNNTTPPGAYHQAI